MTKSNLHQFNPENYCAIYARRGSKNEDNIENQLQSCRSKATELNLVTFKEYLDFQSATKYEPFQRVGLRELIDDLKDNKFKTLIVFKIDRLARNITHFKEIKSLCRQNNVRLVYSSSDEPNFEDDNELSSLIENISLSFSAIEPVSTVLKTQDSIE